MDGITQPLSGREDRGMLAQWSEVTGTPACMMVVQRRLLLEWNALASVAILTLERCRGTVHIRAVMQENLPRGWSFTVMQEDGAQAENIYKPVGGGQCPGQLARGLEGKVLKNQRQRRGR